MRSINDQNLSVIRIIALTRDDPAIMPQERLVDGLTAPGPDCFKQAQRLPRVNISS